MQQTHAQPTGRRTLTPKMIAARIARPPEWEPAKRGAALSALKQAAPALGMPRRLPELADYLVGRTRPADWAEAGGRPMAFPSNATLQDVMDLGRSQVQTLIRMGMEWGLWDMIDSPTGHRRGVIQDGRIIEAYGFDLTPLAVRRAEFEAIGQAHRERRREGARLRRRIISLRKQVQALAEAGIGQDITGVDWPALSVQAFAVAGLRGDSEDPAQLAPLVERLTALQAQAEEALFSGLNEAVDGVETGSSGLVDRAPNTPTQQPTAKADTVGNGGPVRPKAHNDQSGGDRSNSGTDRQNRVEGQPVTVAPRHAAVSGPLYGFIVTTGLLLQLAPAFRGWVGSAQPSWDEMIEAASYVCSELGISRYRWGQACLMLGRLEAVTVVALIAAKHAAGGIEQPEAYLWGMLRKHAQGNLRLDGTLYGWMDRLREGQPGRGSAPARPGRRSWS